MKPGTKSTLLAGDRITSDEGVIMCAGLEREGLTSAGLSGEGLL